MLALDFYDIPLFPELRSQIKAIAEAEAPKEACGLFIENANGDWRVEQCVNSHADPEHYFCIDASETAKYTGDANGAIAGVWHSHTTGLDDFSPADIKMARSLNLPFYLVCSPSGKERWFDPEEILPLLGREWALYRNCHTLMVDIYRQELKINLEYFDFEKPEQWTDETFDPVAVTKSIEQGFIRIGNKPWDVQLQKYDVFLMRMPGQKMPCHVGVLTQPDRNIFMHHLTGRFSEESVYGGQWAKHTEAIYRHKNLF